MLRYKKSIIILLISFYGISTFLKNDSEKEKVVKNARNFSVKESQKRTVNVDFRLITAFSDNHFDEAIRGCLSIGNLSETRNWKNGFMIAFLLSNLTKAQIHEYQNACPFIEIRKFNFKAFPKFFKNLSEYRWKPVIIENMVNEFKNILYFDSSIIFHQNPEDTITDLIKEQHYNYSKCGIRQFDNSKHTIFTATHPALYKLLKFDQEIAKHHVMYGAGLLTATKHPKSTKIIQKWVKCAKEEYCMAPLNSEIVCDAEKFKNAEYANCHRFDQSVLSILLVKYCSRNYNDHFAKTPLLEVKRL